MPFCFLLLSVGDISIAFANSLSLLSMSLLWLSILFCVFRISIFKILMFSRVIILYPSVLKLLANPIIKIILHGWFTSPDTKLYKLEHLCKGHRSSAEGPRRQRRYFLIPDFSRIYSIHLSRSLTGYSKIVNHPISKIKGNRRDK